MGRLGRALAVAFADAGSAGLALASADAFPSVLGALASVTAGAGGCRALTVPLADAISARLALACADALLGSISTGAFAAIAASFASAGGRGRGFLTAGSHEDGAYGRSGGG